MSPVVLINPFEVPKGQEVECLAFWDRAAAFMRQQPGFIATRLHKALSPEARFHFSNITEWQSAANFHAAIASPEFQQLIASYMEICPHYHGLYEVIRT